MRGGYRTSELTAELELWRVAGQRVRLWLRDDDAEAPGPELDRLLGSLRRHRAPCLVAVVPMRAGRALADRLAGEALVRVAMHGAWHANHAPAGRKPEETPAERGLEAIVTELAAARGRLMEHFGAAAGRWYVPPWNRIGPQVAARLPGLGFQAISTFADNLLHLEPELAQANTHVDIMDWKGGRIGRPFDAVTADLAAKLANARARGFGPVGLLTHHLAHDATAWETLDRLLGVFADDPAMTWSAPDDVLAG
jgi:hypothetical protein